MTTPLQAAAAARTTELQGVGLYVLAVFCFAAMDVVAKGLMERHEPMMVVWARYASQGAWVTLILLPRLGRVARTDRPGLQIARSVLPFFATFFFFTALQAMPLAEAVATFEIAPLLITAMAFFVLKEPVGPRRWIGVGVGFLGALIIVRPGAQVFDPAALLPMAAAFCFAGYAIATRFLPNAESPATSFFYTAVIGALLASLAVPFFWSTPDLEDAAIMATFGLLGGAGQLLMILALRRASASAVAPFNYTGLVWSAAWGFFVFAEVPDLATVLGATVIVSAGLYVWWRERLRAGKIS